MRHFLANFIAVILTLMAGLRAAETTEQRAARLLDDAARNQSVRAQANRQEADAAYQTGLTLMNDLEYEEAKKFFERALDAAPGHEQARAKLRVVNSLLGVHTDRIGERTRELAAEARVQEQETVMVIQNLIDEARKFEEKAIQSPHNAERTDRASVLSEQLQNLHKAQDRLIRAKELLNWLPSYIKFPGSRSQVDAELRRLSEQLGK